MEIELIKQLTGNFESHVKKTSDGVEFWLARDLQGLLGYTKWDNFLTAVDKAKISCEKSRQAVSDHFIEASRQEEIGSGAVRELADVMLTRYACYLIAQNGDPRKPEIAFAQTYFAVQTRKLELIEQRISQSERLTARKKLAETEKELSKVIFDQTGSEKNFGVIRSKGDRALFGYSTEQMKGKWKVPQGRALADYAPTIILKAKDFATEITIFNAKAKKLKVEPAISSEHVKNNRSVRKALLERGIRPETLPPEEDVKILGRKLQSEGLKSLGGVKIKERSR